MLKLNKEIAKFKAAFGLAEVKSINWTRSFWKGQRMFGVKLAGAYYDVTIKTGV